MKKTIYISFLFVVMLAFSSCATLLGGSKKGVRVSGVQAQAKVYYNGSYIGDAPVNVKVPKSAKQGNSKITVKADNYKPTDIQLTRKWSLGYTVLDICTGVLPLVVDAATGNIYQPKPGHVKFDLEPVDNIASKFKVGDEITIINKKFNGQKAKITQTFADGVQVEFVRPATAVEKQTKKVDEITENIKLDFSEIRK